MRIFSIISLNLILILVFFLLVQQKNKDLTRQLVQIENSIHAQKDLQLAIQNFKSQQQQILSRNESIAQLERKKYETLDSVLNLANELPAGIALIDFTKSGSLFSVTGKATSEEDLRTLINLRHLKLLKSKRLFFEVSGSL